MSERRSLSSVMSGISEFMEQEERDRLVDLRLKDIDPDPEQDRHSWDSPDTQAHLEAMTASVAEHGVRRPIEVFEHSDGRYQIIAGEVRYRASVAAGRDTIPALLRLKSDERQRSLDMLTENFSRLSLTPMELARGLKRRLDEGITREEILESTGKDKPWFSRMLGLLDLPEDVQAFAETGAVRDPARLHSLAKIDEDDRADAFEKIASGESFAVVVSEALPPAASKEDKAKKPAKKKPFQPDLTATRDEARLLIHYFHPDRDLESDESLDQAFKDLMGELSTGKIDREADGRDQQEA